MKKQAIASPAVRESMLYKLMRRLAITHELLSDNEENLSNFRRIVGESASKLLPILKEMSGPPIYSSILVSNLMSYNTIAMSSENLPEDTKDAYKE